MESPLSLFRIHWDHELERPERGCVGVKGRQPQRVEKSGVLPRDSSCNFLEFNVIYEFRFLGNQNEILISLESAAGP